jgi:hypothetical protein
VIRVLLLCVMLAGVAHADSWGPAESRSWHSPDESFVVEVFVPGARHNAGKQAFAYAYRVTSRSPTLVAKLVWKGALANRRAPYAAFATNDGHFITLDDWGSQGHDHAVVLYSRAGKLLRDYHLDKLAVPDDAKNVNVSVSSRNWLRHAVYFHDAKRKRFRIDLAAGTLDLSLTDGTHRWIPVSPKPRALGDRILINEVALKFATLTDLVKP